jgi:hypothetical protein
MLIRFGVPPPFRLTLIVAVALSVIVRASDGPSAKDVMRRVTAYVDAYGEKASIVVATERYTQTLAANGKQPEVRRTLVAEFAIVRSAADRQWVGFRDVVAVDGAALPDREDRLRRVLTSPDGGLDEARRINDESARFNIGDIERNFNVPTAALFFFTSENLHRFKFTRRGACDSRACEITFRETRRPTLVRTPDGVSTPSRGTLLVDPADGTVERTQIHLTHFAGPGDEASADVEVTYRFVDAVALWVPDVMTETYFAATGFGRATRVTGRAEYSNYRRFQTSARIK